MAGSWRHMTTGSGKFRNNHSFFQLVENGGDWYETCEECYGMVWWLALQLAARTDGEQRIPTRDEVLEVIAMAEASYKDGLAMGGVQRSR